MFISSLNISAFLTFDYVHIFKNVRNNWITVSGQTLVFEINGVTYRACWSDIVKLYEADRVSTLRLTKLTHCSVFPKPLQRQSVPLVCQVFNDKTVSALETLKSNLSINEGTIVFIKLVTDWFKIMNVKDRYSAIAARDELRSPWIEDSRSFDRLYEVCNVISTCMWQGGRGRVEKLIKQTQCE